MIMPRVASSSYTSVIVREPDATAGMLLVPVCRVARAGLELVPLDAPAGGSQYQTRGSQADNPLQKRLQLSGQQLENAGAAAMEMIEQGLAS